MRARCRLILGVLAILVGMPGCSEDTESPTAPHAGAAPSVVASATGLAFRQISAGDKHTCGVATDDRAYCWGSGFPGEVGHGVPNFQYCMDWDDCVTRPAAVVGGLRFRVVSAGYDHSCGVTTDDRAFCWGSNENGTLGIGATTGPDVCAGNESNWSCSTVPVAVLGGLRFRTVSAGFNHTCGITTDGLAYCWGSNASGQLGDGTTNTRPKPRLVAAGLRYHSVSAGAGYTCALTTDRWAYCWGGNASGQLGDSTHVARRLRPVRVAGGRGYRQLDAGWAHTCGIGSDSRAYCWGKGDVGQLGVGRVLTSLWPRRVAGGLRFDRVTAGSSHTCAEASDNRAYCWGLNSIGQLGDGTQTQRLAPVPVIGGLLFAQLTAGESHTCGRTATDVLYCWGDNRWGQLGDGTLDFRLTPTAVLGGS
jgi:alpha-tubulin suppressor-like RCC1 family protein